MHSRTLKKFVLMDLQNIKYRIFCFRFDLPNGRSVGIKANPSKTLGDILFPVMKKNGFDLEDFSIYVVSCGNVIIFLFHLLEETLVFLWKEHFDTAQGC